MKKARMRSTSPVRRKDIEVLAASYHQAEAKRRENPSTGIRTEQESRLSAKTVDGKAVRKYQE